MPAQAAASAAAHIPAAAAAADPGTAAEEAAQRTRARLPTSAARCWRGRGGRLGTVSTRKSLSLRAFRVQHPPLRHAHTVATVAAGCTGRMSSSDVAGAGSSASNPQESVSDLGLVRLGPANGFTGGPPAAAETDMSTALLPARRCGLNASPRLYLLVGVSSIGGFLFGYDTGVVSGALLLIRATSYEGGLGGDSPLDHFEQETIVSSTIACCIVGSLCSGRASQQCGRKPVLITACLIFTAGALLMAAAPSLLVLVPQRMAVRVAGPQPTPQPKPWPQPQPSPLLEPNPRPKPQLGALSRCQPPPPARWPGA